MFFFLKMENYFRRLPHADKSRYFFLYNFFFLIKKWQIRKHCRFLRRDDFGDESLMMKRDPHWVPLEGMAVVSLPDHP